MQSLQLPFLKGPKECDITKQITIAPCIRSLTDAPYEYVSIGLHHKIL